jgi:hypothetical protein
MIVLWREFWRRVFYALDVVLHGVPAQPTIILHRPRNMRRRTRGRSRA